MATEKSKDFKDGFDGGVFYERTRIMDSLRTAFMPDPTDEKVIKFMQEGGVFMVPLDQLVQFSVMILTQPFHSWEESIRVAEESAAVTIAEVTGMIDRLDKTDPEKAAYLRNLMNDITE